MFNSPLQLDTGLSIQWGGANARSDREKTKRRLRIGHYRRELFSGVVAPTGSIAGDVVTLQDKQEASDRDFSVVDDDVSWIDIQQ